MGVRFCLISALEQLHLFHLIYTQFFLSGPALWPPCLEGVVHLWCFWCEEALRRETSSSRGYSHPPHVTQLSDAAHGPLASSVPCRLPNQRFGPCAWPSGHRSHQALAKLLGSTVSYKTRQTAGGRESLAFHWGFRNSAALLWKPVQWRHCASTALTNITKPGRNDHAKVPWREEIKCLLMTRLNLIYHAPKWSSSCSESFGAQSWRKLSSAIRFMVSKNTILFQTS